MYSQVPGLAESLKTLTKNYYALQLVAPFLERLSDKHLKVPTKYRGMSAVYRSKQIIEVTHASTGGARFSIAAQPFMGINNTGTALTRGEQTLVTKTATDFTGATSWSLNSQYDTAAFKDPYFDDFLSGWGWAYFTGQAATQTNALPFGAAVTVSPALSDRFDLFPYNGTTGEFTLPSGSYYVIAVVPGAAIGIETITTTGSPVVTNYISNPTTTQALSVSFSYIRNDSSALDTVKFTFAAGTVSAVTPSQLAIVRVPGGVSNLGIMQQLRCTSMDMLVTFIGDTLYNGGEIAMGQLPKAQLPDNFMQNSTHSPGQLQLKEYLQELPGIRKLKLKRGGYAWWCPTDVSDELLYSPSAVINQFPPTLICSGVITNTGGATGGLVRVEIIRNFEYVTSSRVPIQSPLNNDVLLIGQAAKLLAPMPQVMENDEHVPNILNFFKRIGMGVDKFFDMGTKAINKYAMNLAPAAEAYGPLAVRAFKGGF